MKVHVSGYRTALLAAGGLMLACLIGPPANAQQVTGTPGSPAATTTINGKQLAAADVKASGEAVAKARD